MTICLKCWSQLSGEPHIETSWAKRVLIETTEFSSNCHILFSNLIREDYNGVFI